MTRPGLRRTFRYRGSKAGWGLRGLQARTLAAERLSVRRPDTWAGRYDRITVAWLGDAGATIDRHIVAPAPGTARPEETDADGAGR